MEGTSLYRPILKKAWLTTKKFKGLWFFGLFAATLGAGGEYEILSRGLFNNEQGQGVISGTIESFQRGWQEGSALTDASLWSSIGNIITSNPQVIIGLLLSLILSLTVTIFFIWLAVVSQIALINNASQIDKNKKPTINQGIDFAVRKFWPVLSINVVLKVILFVLFLVLGKEAYMLAGEGISQPIIYYASFVVFMAIVFVASFVAKFQIFYITLQKQDIKTSIKSGWELFRKNWLISLEISFILFLVFLVGITLIGLLTYYVFVPALIVMKVFWHPTLSLITVWLGAMVLIALILIMIGIISAFQWIVWTLLFEKLIGRDNTVSKLVRGGEQVGGYFRK